MNTLKIVAVADLHGRLPEIPECDLLLIAGDISPIQCRNLEYVGSWLERRFARWLERIPAKHVVGVAGNHDYIFQVRRGSGFKKLRWHYLQDGGISVAGVRIWGSPWSVRYRCWAFEVDDEEKLPMIYAGIPEGTDIIVSHCPPFGVGDTCAANPAAVPIGSRALLARVRELKPKVVVFGHAHTGQHGAIEIAPGSVGYNVSVCDDHNHPTYEVTRIEMTVNINDTGGYPDGGTGGER